MPQTLSTMMAVKDARSEDLIGLFRCHREDFAASEVATMPAERQTQKRSILVSLSIPVSLKSVNLPETYSA